MIDTQAIRDMITLTAYLAAGFTAGILATIAARRLRTHLSHPRSS